MSKPILDIEITTVDEKLAQVKAVFDSGSFYTIIREDKLPIGTVIEHRANPRQFSTAAQGEGKVLIIGNVSLVLTIGNKMIEDSAFVSPNLSTEMIVGAKTMQSWHISIINGNGETKVVVGLDMRDPDIMTII